MKLTTRGRYAVTAMLDLALHAQSGPVSLSDIAGRQAISLSYLEQLFAKLKRATLVVSSRGPGGGYLPARPLHAVSVADIVDAVDERIDATRCGGHGNCQDGETCLTHQLWAELSSRIHDYLRSISLASLAERQHVQHVAHRLEERRLEQRREDAARRDGSLGVGDARIEGHAHGLPGDGGGDDARCGQAPAGRLIDTLSL